MGVGIGKAKVQAELLFKQLGLDDLDVEQLHIGILIVSAQPGRAAAEQGQQCKVQAGAEYSYCSCRQGHVLAPKEGTQCNKQKLGCNRL
ncbi:hypothetical protein D3C77_719230 [compost metagenome]